MKTLTRNEVITNAKELKNGTFMRVAYKSDLPLKAAHKNEGYRISKITETTGRLGVRYGMIHTVIERKANTEESGRNYTNNYEWEIPNKVAYNSNTNREYLTIANVPHGHNTRHKFIVEKPNGDTYTVDNLNEEKNLVINSYWNRDYSNCGEIKYIPVENILRLNDIGIKAFA